MLRLMLGKDWITIRDTILSHITDDVAEARPGAILMVPELISHDTERLLCQTVGDSASRFAEVLTFTRLARCVADWGVGGLLPCLDNGGRVVAMAAAARQLHSKLKAYASFETQPEFLSMLVDSVDEFKRCCITSQDLAAAAAQTEGSLAQKLEELSLLFEAYDGLCSHGRRDPRDQMSWLLEQLEDCSFAQAHRFYIDGFPDFTRQHMAILEHMIRVSPMVTVGLNCDQPDSHAMAFEKAAQTAAELIKIALKLGIPYEIIHIPQRKDRLEHVREALFQGNLPTNINGLQVIRTGTIYMEVQAAAEQILQLVHSGFRYRDISVVCGDMASYQNLVDMVFHRCGIPMYRSGTDDVLNSTVICTVLSALEAALGGFEQRDVMRYLKSTVCGLEQDICDRMENYAILWNIRGNRWQEVWTKHPEGINEVWTEDAYAQLELLNIARVTALQPLFCLHSDFQKAQTLAEQVDALYAFFERISLEERLSQLAQQWDADGDNRSAQILNQLWEILLSALEQIRDVLGQTAWDNHAFTRLLTLLLSQYDVGTIPPVLDAVMVGPVSAMRYRQAKHLLVLGATEGALPGYSGSIGVLTDQERVLLRHMGVPLTGGSMDGIQAEFAEIYGVFCGATDTITVFYPGEQPSYICRRLAQMCGGETEITPQLGAALIDPKETGAFLAKHKAADAAAFLEIEPCYQWISRRVQYNIGDMERKTVHELYGGRLNLSASQIDRQAECRMSYFLKYGLRAKERKEASVNPAEFGTYIHSVLEKTAREVMNRGGFHHVSFEDTMDIALKHSADYAHQFYSQMDSSRIVYLFQRNRRELEMVVAELWQELKESNFEPLEFELAFGEQGTMECIEVPASSMQAVLRGFVDRVDLWQDGNRHYFRIVDYKTGKKDFDYCDIFNGVGLQMLLYLFALERNGERLLGDHPIAAGVQYFPARVPLLASDGRLTADEAESARKKEWKRKGLLLHDERVLTAMEPDGTMQRLSCKRSKDGELSGDICSSQQFKTLRTYIFSLLGEMVDEIASGNISPNPYTRGTSHNACTYCPYFAVCQGKIGDGRRNYKAMTAQRFWDEVEKEVDHHG